MTARIAKLRRDESGFTLIELMVAISLLAVGVMGLVGSIDSGRKLDNTAENTEVMSHVAERQMENLHDLPYAALAVTAAPATSATDFVCAGAPVTYNWDRTACTSTNKEPFVVDATNGQVNSQSWFDARTNARGTMKTFITYVNDPDCSNAVCGGTQDYKRLTVVVSVANGKPRTPVVATSFAYDSDNMFAGKICGDPTILNSSNQPVGRNCG